MTEVSGSTNEKKHDLALLAAEQYGYFTAGQAIGKGYSNKHHYYHVKEGHWLKVEKGLYRLPGYGDSMEAEFTKWCLWSRNQHDQPQGIISHQSALAFHGLSEYNPAQIYFTVPSRFRKKTPDCLVLHNASLKLSVIESHGCFMVTRPFQTLTDMRVELERSGEWEKTTGKAAESGLLGRGELDAMGIGAAAQGEVILSKMKDNTASQQINRKDPVTKGVWNMIYERTEQARRSRRAGFTLVELLVVIAIISILAGMLIPALGKSLDCARQIKCVATLKQLGTACMLYADDNKGWMPSAQYKIYFPSPVRYMNTWVVQTMQYVADDREWDETRPLPEIYTCSANMAAREVIEPVGKSTTYGYNRRMGIIDSNGNIDSPAPSYRMRKLGKAKYPSQFGIIADKSAESVTSSEFPHLEFYNYTFACLYLATVHSGDTDMLYADGHAEKLAVLPDVNWRRLGIFSSIDYSSDEW